MEKLKEAFFGPVKVEDIRRTNMYQDYLNQQQKRKPNEHNKKGDRLILTFPDLWPRR